MFEPNSNAKNILKIVRQNNSTSSKYVLNKEALKSLLEPIKDKNVAIIPFVGPSRMGKSFMLNYIVRFLTNPSSNWLGDKDDPLDGFHWKTDYEPQTFGIWISEPFLLKRSNGEEIVILLMDTQGVFDDKSTKTDWMTIVGISLLLSSCLVFNINQFLQEDILNTLDSFLEYGLLAAKTKDGSVTEKPFQTLLFLIRDWNTPAQFKFGLNGGKQFLERKLEVKEDMSSEAQKNRQLVKQCFNEINCFLLPHIGQKSGEEGFTGCVGQLEPRFVDKMKEFITHLLNPEEIALKQINKNNITCSELVAYFESYVDIFNSDKLPTPEAIKDATEKTAYLIQLNKIKDKHLKRLQKFFATKQQELHSKCLNKFFELEKQFIPEEVLQEFNKKIVSEYIEILEQDRFFVKTDIDKTYQQFESNCNSIIKEIRNCRVESMKVIVEKCGSIFEHNLRKAIDSKIMESYALDELFDVNKETVFAILKNNFCGEKEELFSIDLVNLKEMINKIEVNLRKENNLLHKEYEDKCSKLVKESLILYMNTMESMVESLKLISKEQFRQSEIDAKLKSRKFFQDNISETSNSKFTKRFNSELEEKLRECKDVYKQQFNKKCENMASNAKVILQKSIEFYEKNLDEVFEIVSSDDDLQRKHKYFEKQALDQFYQNCPLNDSLFLESYLNDFKLNIEKIFNNFKFKLIERNKVVHHSYESRAILSKQSFIQSINKLISNNESISADELKRCHRNLRKDSINQFESNFKSNVGIDNLLLSYSNQLKEDINDEFEKILETHKHNLELRQLEQKSEELLQTYRVGLNESRKLAINESELMAKHEELKSKIINSFKNMESVSGKLNFNSYQQKLLKQINDLFIEVKQELIERKAKLNSYKSSLSDAKTNYSNKMEILFRDDKIYSDNYLDNFHRKYKRDTINKYKNQFESDSSADDYQETYLNKLDQLIDEEFDRFKANNKQKRTEKEREIDEKFKEYSEIYEFEMEKKSEFIQGEEELLVEHERVEKKIIKVFNDQNPIRDPELLKGYLNQLKEDLDLSFKAIKAKLNRNVIKDKINEAKNSYKQKMEKMLNNNEYNMDSKDYLNESHEKNKKHALLQFKSQLFGSYGLFEKHSPELRDVIDLEFEKFNQKYVLKRESDEKQSKLQIEEYLMNYKKSMNSSMNLFESESDLSEKHRNIKKEIVEKFMETNNTIESQVLAKFKKTLTEKIDKSLNEFTETLKNESDKSNTMMRFLKKDIRKTYSDEIDKYFKNSSFLTNDSLLKINENVIKLLFDKYNRDKGNMSDEKYNKLIRETVEDLFENIKDKNAMNIPNSPAIGIDLGTTNSCVAYYRKNAVNVIPNELKRLTTPSVISIRDDEEVVGDVAKDDIFIYPKNTFYSIKRLVGREFNDPSVQNNIQLLSYKVVDDGYNNPKLSLKVKGREQTFFAEQISAKVLKKMKDIAETHLGCEVSKAVITVPAYFNDTQKEATKDAGRLAGLEVLKIINEPTAAAIAYQLNHIEDIDPKNVLIYDFGGGTFDVAVLEIDRRNINVKAVGGDNYLGGDDIDNNLIDYCLKQFTSKTGLTLDGIEKDNAICRLRQKCQDHKCRLAAVESTGIAIENFFQENDLNVVLTRKKFEEINNSLFLKTIELVDKALEDANLSSTDINDIVLVGGSTRILKVQQMLSYKFNGRPLNHYLDPDEAVARGAAVQAAILNGQQAKELDHIKLSDVAPMSLGIEVGDDVMSVIIPRNSKVPNVFTQTYLTSNDSQTDVTINVYEGESERVSNNHFLSKFVLSGIPPAPQGQHKLFVKFEVNDEGILHVSAQIEGTGVGNEIQINVDKRKM